MTVKTAVIGAGSVGFTRRLVPEILAVPEPQDVQFALTDTSERDLGMVAQLCERDISANGLGATLSPALEQREAVRDADYVVCAIRQGGLEAFRLDTDVPLKYGIDQCVGDTICAGGLMYAQRTIPVLDLCNDIRELAKPDALFLNYANPVAMNSWACNAHGGVKTLGLRRRVQDGHKHIASAVECWAKGEALSDEDESVTLKDLVVCAGINHQAGYTQVQRRGRDTVPKLVELFKNRPVYSEQEETEARERS